MPRRIFGVISDACSLMIPVLVSATLSTPSGRAPVAMSKPQLYMSSALDGKPLKSSQSAYARAASSL